MVDGVGDVGWGCGLGVEVEDGVVGWEIVVMAMVVGRSGGGVVWGGNGSEKEGLWLE